MIVVMAQAPSHVLTELASRREQFFGFVRGRVSTAAEADDLLQRGFVKAANSVSALRDPARADAWFYQILRRILIDHRSSVAECELTPARTAVAEVVCDEPATCACSLQLLETLPPRYAEVLRRIDLDEESIDEVARSLSLRSGTVTVRLHRARRALRQRLLASCGTRSARQCLDCACASGGIPATG